MATEPEGLCNQNGIKIQSDSIQISEDGTFAFTVRFSNLASRYFSQGNLWESKAGITTDRPEGSIRMASFVAEFVGDAWQIKIKFQFPGRTVRFVNLKTCDTFFRLE